MAAVVSVPANAVNNVAETAANVATETARKVGFVRADGKLAPLYSVMLASMMGMSVFTTVDSLLLGFFPSTQSGGKRFAKMAGASTVGFAAFVGVWLALRR